MNKPQEELPLMEDLEKNIVLFYPHVPLKAIQYVEATLHTRWIGQGPDVAKFENMFSKKFGLGNIALAVGSGTDALHLAYILADIKPDDEVIVPVFTCTATNIPLLYIGAKVVFADVQPNTLNIDPKHVQSLVNEKTKAIVCVHYGGLPCDMRELNEIAKKWNIPIIEDAAHAVGAIYNGKPIGSISDFTMFSFQAIKHITTGDGGMLLIRDQILVEKGKRIRWFGIDRSKKQMGMWENDITEIGYKYQMTDISAAMGIAALEEIDDTINYRKNLLKIYENNLLNIPGITFLGGGFNDREHAAWLCTVAVENRIDLMHKLRQNNIESGQVHYRNDRYSIFGGRKNNLPNMDNIEEKYLVLPLHMRLKNEDVLKVCEVIKSGW